MTTTLRRLTTVWLAALPALLASCGGNASNSPSSATTADSGASAAPGNYLPLAVGMSWTYNVTSASGATGQGSVAVEAAENAPGAGNSALRVRTTLPDEVTVGWEQSTGSSVVRFEEQQLDQSGSLIVDKQYMPAILVLDESAAHLVAGATWTESYQEQKSTKKKASKEQADWTVEAVADSITVPAGTYTCIRVRRIHSTSQTPSNTLSWYAPGVGRVRETGAGQNNDETLELASVSMP
jgi:hypothetical protein